jgi:hypothetical protein
VVSRVVVTRFTTVTPFGTGKMPSMAVNLLSALECKNATVGHSKIRKLHDGGGLYLWVYHDGRKYWRMRFWQMDKEKSLSLGVYPAVSLVVARKKAEELRQQLEAGLDPAVERKVQGLRKKAESANSFQAVANEWYQKNEHTWVQSHARDVMRRLELNIFPFLGGRPLQHIEAAELLEVLRKIEQRGAYDLAHRVLQVCGQIFRYGIATGRCTRNLSADLRGALAPHVPKHQAAVRLEELPDLLKSLARYDHLGDRKTCLAGRQENMSCPAIACTYLCADQ